MKNAKNASPPQARKKTQPEEFDLLILEGGMRRFGSKVMIIGRSGRLMAWASPMRKQSASRQTTWEKCCCSSLA